MASDFLIWEFLWIVLTCYCQEQAPKQTNGEHFVVSPNKCKTLVCSITTFFPINSGVLACSSHISKNTSYGQLSIYILSHLNSSCRQLSPNQIFFSWDTSFPTPNRAIEKMVPFFGCLGYIRDEILHSYTGIIKSTTSYIFFFVVQLISCFIFSKRDVGRLVFAQAIFAWSWLFQDWQDWVRSPMLGCFLVERNDDLLDVWLGVKSSRWRSYIYIEREREIEGVACIWYSIFLIFVYIYGYWTRLLDIILISDIHTHK